MNPTLASTNQTAILGRSFDLRVDEMSVDVARFIMSMELADHDQRRLEELAEQARHDTLNESDEAELEEYRRAGRLMEMMKLKARMVLRKIA
jgi:hypothetical protein